MTKEERDEVMRLGNEIKKDWPLATLSLYLFSLLNLLSLSALATPLDDRIAAFEQADTQSEGAVANVLKAGLDEQRSAEALAAVRPWLPAN